MPNLSPQAQEVFWEFNRAASGKPDDWHYLPAIAAALRATADQVVPEERKECEHFTNEAIRLNRMGVRAELLAIAAELEAQ